MNLWGSLWLGGEFIMIGLHAEFLLFLCHNVGSLSLMYNQQDATFSQSVYFRKLLYMFRAVPPPIIRSTELYIWCQVLSNQYCRYRGRDVIPSHPR
jgi:hypothetical protein